MAADRLGAALPEIRSPSHSMHNIYGMGAPPGQRLKALLSRRDEIMLAWGGRMGRDELPVRGPLIVGSSAESSSVIAAGLLGEIRGQAGGGWEKAADRAAILTGVTGKTLLLAALR